MEDKHVKLLKFFGDVSVGEPKSISPFLVENFTKPLIKDDSKWALEFSKIKNLTDDLKAQGFLMHSTGYNGNKGIGQYYDPKDPWYDEIDFYWYKTIEAEKYLDQLKLNRSTRFRANLSLIIAIISVIITVVFKLWKS